MPGLGLGIDLSLGSRGGGGAVTYDADATALFDRSGSAFTTPEKTAYNALIVGLKADGLWTLLDTLVVASGDNTKSLLNIKGGTEPSPSGNYALNAYDRFSGDGSSAYLDLGYKTSSQNDASFGIWVLSDLAESTGDMGNTNATLIVRSASTPNTMFARLNGPTVSISGVTDSRGFWHVNRISSANIEMSSSVYAYGSSPHD